MCQPLQRSHGESTNQRHDGSSRQRSAQELEGRGFPRARWRPQPWWLIFLVLMMANYLLMRVFFPEPSSITIPYTFFKKQVEAGNVEDVTSVGDSIQGSFKAEVTYPAQESPSAERQRTGAASADQPKPRTSKRFKTQRPAFADPGLERLLEEKGVVIEAVDESVSSWFKLLVGFGPTLLLIAAFVWISRRAAAAAVAGCSASAAAAPSATARSSRRSPSTTSPASTRPRTS